MQRILFLILSLLSFTRSIAQFDSSKSIIVDGSERHYNIHFPLSYHSSKRLPVIFAFHQGGMNIKEAIKLFNLNTLADEQHFIVVYPVAHGKTWNIPGINNVKEEEDSTNSDDKADDVRFVAELADSLIIEYKADSTRMFATGMGRGGMFTLYLAEKLTDRIRAIAPVCGGIAKSMALGFVLPHTIPILMINGTDDPLINYNGGKGKVQKLGTETENTDMMMTEELVDKLARLDSCDIDPQVSDLPDDNHGDACTALETIYSCKVTVDYIAVIGGGHTWPGGIQYLPKSTVGKVCRDFNAEDKIYEFFESIK